jgi:hypothetical protein
MWKLRQRIAPGAMVDVSEVKTDGRVLDARLAWSRIAYLNFLMTKLFGAAIPVNANGIDAAHAIFLDDLTERARDHPGGPILTFTSRLRMLSCKCWNQRSTSTIAPRPGQVVSPSR